MSLDTVKSLTELSPDQIEQLLNNIRVKRLYLRVEFKKAYDVKLSAQSIRHKRLLDKQLQIMAKDMEALDKKIETCAQRLDKIKVITNQISYINDVIAEED